VKELELLGTHGRQVLQGLYLGVIYAPDIRLQSYRTDYMQIELALLFL
jgi:hypothetical protein